MPATVRPGIKQLVLYFDVVSPYVCLNWHVLQRYQKRWDFDLILKPIFLGGVMKTTGN